MSFEFLAPDQAGATATGPRPALRSAIELEHLDSGARIAERAGWRVVADYGAPEKEAGACRRTVGVADLSCLGKLELQGDAATVAAALGRLAGGATLELGRATGHDGVWWCPLTRERVIAVTPPEATERVREGLEAAASSASAGFASVTELTAALGSNVIAGPQARETFARTTALDMRPEHFGESAFAPVSVARTPGMVLNEGGDRFLHIFGAGYAQYNWTVFVDAAESLGGRAVGIEALDA